MKADLNTKISMYRYHLVIKEDLLFFKQIQERGTWSFAGRSGVFFWQKLSPWGGFVDADPREVTRGPN